ncbi:MAG: recombinase family protein, partial [Chitinophagaceae bacterium]
MKQRAYLYIRVSTDEQAEKGYSQKHQDDRLRQHCEHQGIEIVDSFWEDYSGKTFDRPEFNKLMEHLKKHRSSADLLLFLKWDRFSRNVAESYVMISRLAKMGIEPQAIEQPLDMTIPESKIMLAIYLAAPEVENDRRSLNTIAGMRKAMKEGRHVNMAPRGYRNARDENNNPIIERGKDAPLIEWAFQETAKGVLNVMEIWKMVKAKGLKVGKSQMWNLLRNPVYSGRIFVPAYKDEKAVVIKASHQPIISLELFEEVQDVLNGRKRKFPTRQTAKDELPLRGYLQCKQCSSKLTGSASKGNGGKYFYYHCQKGCKERFKAELANKEILKEFVELSSNNGVIRILKESLETHLRLSKTDKVQQKEKLGQEIEKARGRITSARRLMLDKEIDATEYKEIKLEYEGEIEKLERKIEELSTLDSDLKEHISFCCDLLQNLPKYFVAADLTAKQQILGSILQEKLVFSENQYRTIKYRNVVSLICRPGKNYKGRGNKKSSENSELSNLVPRTEFELVHYL